MKTEGYKRSAGSAMIIAFLLMAVVSGSVFAIARLFYLDTALGSLYENSIVAYYAAESGVEEGLLRYRYNRNAEVASATDDYLNYNYANRNNLVTGEVSSNIGKATTISSPAQQIYDLNLYYKTLIYGTDSTEVYGILDQNDINSASYEKEYTVIRDEAVKVDITNIFSAGGSGDLQFWVKLANPSTGMTDSTSFIEAKITGTVGGNLKEFKKALIQAGTSSTRNWNSDTYSEMQAVSATNRIYKINFLKTEIAGAYLFDTTQDNQVYLYLKPLGYDNIKIGLAPTVTGNALASPYSTIKSTGYYGGIGRTLSAKIDRQTGTIYDLFDYVMYQHL